ncbi:dienelactone hydrolase family protein [Pseudorhodobacter sp. MZDSW-24AT]|uniref:dienelactone hydrolase family protein n=1 Tax=Pseudorhodobacter sp. MZDSW-24AT TaxID=2052957 RepID=UPI000C1DE4BE|nr:alpha/beta hydrolase family protein [Pseudorhodobacter sp. MZDSW-24AT]PJF08569.1 hydrolase [Pseudorhodobacter sp. MZDSW-24AT]
MISDGNLVPALLTQWRARGFALAWTGGDVAAWQARARPVARALALADLPEVAVGARRLAVEGRDGHRAESWVLDLGHGLEAPALMLWPEGPGPFPAVLALHDHGSEFRIGKEKCIPPLGGADAGAEAWAARFFGGQPIGPALVARGFAVLCVDALGWGARAGGGYEAQQALAANLLQIGQSAAGVMAWEDARALDWLCAHPRVDAGRVAAVGFSLGGFRAWQVAALTGRVAATVSIGWMASLPELLVPGNNQVRGQSAFWMAHPGLYRQMDLPDMAALAAPRPFWAEVAQGDPLFPAAAVDPAFVRLAAIWAAAGAAERLMLSRPEGGHSFGPARQAAAFDWLAARLA